ncbi:MAG: MerR family transcriptional regulator [Chitinophagaceae bacterium]|nr:MerR family transcriptional regulator [Chitinophagaceae bacterium]
MQQFSIRDIEHLCRVKAHTLRAWEQRYGLGLSERPGGQHRVYSNEDLKKWLQVAYLYHSGYKISAIAAMNLPEMEKAFEAISQSDTRDEGFIHQLISASLEFDKELFEKIISCVVLRNGLDHCIRFILYPYLQRIGMLWLTNHAIPAQEHFASHIIRKKIILTTDGLPPALPGTPVVVIFAPEGEFHEIPLLTANYYFRQAGCRTVYFGTNTSTGSLACYLEEHRADYLFTHVITYLQGYSPENFLEQLHTIFPGIIIRSGPGIAEADENRKKEINLHSLEELISTARRIAGK